jgi:hypothetical protein
VSAIDLDTLLEQLAEQTDDLKVARVHLAELEAARINVASLEAAVAETLRAIAEATGVTVGVPVVPALAAGNAILAAQLKAPPPAPPADEDEETDEPPPVEPARTSLFGGQQRRLPPTPPNTRKSPPVLSEGAGDDEEDDDADDQGDDEDEGADEGDEQPAPKRAPVDRRVKPGSLNERIVELLRKRGPMTSGDIVAELRTERRNTTAALTHLVTRGTLTKSPGYGTPYALAKGAR